MDYNPYLQKAFRTVVHDILADVAQNGTQGDSHYFITFQTNRPDVVIPDFIRDKYPTEMSIILQHQYENLVVKLDCFQVDLSFGGHPYTLKIPFTAITQFVDPTVQFGLNLTPIEPEPAQNETMAEIIDLAALRRK